MAKEKLVSYFPPRACDTVDDLAQKSKNPANYSSTIVNLSIKDKTNFYQPEFYTFTLILSNQILLWILMCVNILALPIRLGLQ